MKKLTAVFSFLLMLLSACSSAQSVDVKEFQKGLDKNAQLVDVRTPQEYNEAHIANAMLINVNDDNFAEHIARLDRLKPVYVYCRSGKRSHVAAGIMKEKGFGKVIELKGGINAWQEAGLKVEKPVKG